MIFKGYSQFSQTRQAEQSRCCLATLPLYQWGHRCLAGQFLQPVQIQCSFQNPQDQGARQGVLCCLLCTTHIALIASFNLPNHFGRKWHPHVKRWEFHWVEKPAVGHTANAHHSWDPTPGLSPTGLRLPDSEALPQPQYKKPSTSWYHVSDCVTEGKVRFLCNSDAVHSEWLCCVCLTWSSFIVLVWDEFTVKTKEDPEKAGFIC